MKKTLILLGLAALAGSAQAFVLIDDFTTGDYLYETNQNAYTTQSGISAITSNRYVAHTFTGNPFTRTTKTQVVDGELRISTGVGVQGRANFNYNGGLKTGVPPQGTGLLTLANMNPANPLIDISGENAIRFNYINNDQASTMLYAYAWNADFSMFNASAGFAVPVGNGTLDIPLASIFTTVDPSMIGMIGFGVLTPDSNDITLTQVAAVPEPASMLALGAGLAALAARRRRK